MSESRFITLAEQPPTAGRSIYDFPGALEDVRRKRDLIERALARGGTRAACMAVAQPWHDGCSGHNLHRLLVAWVESDRDDMVLIDRRKFAELTKRDDKGLPREFTEWAGGEMLGNQRKSRPAYRAILRRWDMWRRTGEAKYAIPGYDAPPAPGNGGHPAGWSLTNLMQQAQPSKAERLVARIGTAAAKSELPMIPGTRDGMRALEYIVFDDVVQDRKVSVPGYLEPVRVLQLGALDVASGVYLKFGLRPDLPRDDGTRQRLQRGDFLLLCAGLLMEHGFPAEYPSRWILERGTATMNAAEAKLLHELTGGMVHVGYTSMDGRFVQAWAEQKSGNSAGKAWIESWHNLFHNEMAALPGQVGKDREHSPALLQGSDREQVALTKVSMMLTPEQRARLVMPYPSIYEAHAQTHEIVRRINARRDHVLEGFKKVMMWRIPGLDGEWQHESALANVSPEIVPHLQWLPVQESPMERLHRLLAEHNVTLRKPNPGGLVAFYEYSHATRPIERFGVTLRIDGVNRYFAPEFEDSSLVNGNKVEVHFEPHDPAQVIVTHKGKFVGVWPRRLVKRGDADALAAEMKHKQSFLGQVASAVRGKMAEKLLAEERRQQNNADVMREAGLGRDEITAGDGGTVDNDTTRRIAAAVRASRDEKQRAAALRRDLPDGAAELLADTDQEDEYTAPALTADELLD